MPILDNPEDFVSGENITASKLNNLVDGAQFVSGSGQTTDDSTLEVHTSGYLKVKDGGINTTQLADDAVETAKIAADAVTYAKMQNVSATDRVLGRDSAGAGDVEEITPSALRTMINVADGAEANVQSDWNATSGDAFIKNKPTIPTNNNQLTNGAGYTTNTGTVRSVATGTGLSGGTITTTGTLNLSVAGNNIGGVKEGGDIAIDTNGVMTLSSNASSSIASATSPGWNFVTQTTIYAPSRTMSTLNVDLQIFGANGIPANARWAMIGHQHNQGQCEVYVGGLPTTADGSLQWVKYGAGGDNINGRSIIIVQNLALPITHEQLTGGSPTLAYPSSSTHSNIIAPGKVKFRFGTNDNDGSGTSHVVKVIAWSY